MRLSFILQSRAFFVLRSFIRAAFSAFKVCCHYIVVISYRIWVLKFSVLVLLDTSPIRSLRYNTFPSRKMKSFIKNFFIKYHQIRSFVRIWLHLLKKSLMENFIFCVVFLWTNLVWLCVFMKTCVDARHFYTTKDKKNWAYGRILLKFKRIFGFQSSWIVNYFSYIYLINDVVRSFNNYKINLKLASLSKNQNLNLLQEIKTLQQPICIGELFEVISLF